MNIVAIMAMVLICFIACTSDDKHRTDAVTDRTQMPVLTVDTVTTLVSDSGITRYRITTVRWEVYDKAKPPYWEFPEGIYLEKFNEQLEAEAYLESDYAYYNEDEQLWRLDGNVHALNLEGEKFETQQLFWNQKTEKVYSDSAITITKATSIITGIGFQSNQTLTKYTIRKPQGVFPIKEE